MLHNYSSKKAHPASPARIEGLDNRSSSDRRRAIGVGILFCFSGVPALIYQIAWQRILVLQSGVGPLSVAIIVASYMAGLGIGSLAGGCLSRRLSARTALDSYAGLELAIGLFALSSGPLYYDLLSIKGARLFSTPWRAGLVQFLALLPPTCLMGMSLPLLARAMVRSGPSASRTIGELYGLNMLGAAIGSVITPWALIPHLGILGAIRVGVGCNLLVGIGVLAIGHGPSGLSRAPVAEILPGHDGLPGRRDQRPFGLWVSLYTLSGFYALALEIIWFRLIDVGVKATAFTFGTVLAVYLFGVATGSLIGARRASRVREPLGMFLLCQCSILIYVGLVGILIASIPVDFWGYRSFFAYWGVYEPLDPVGQNLAAILALYVGLPILLFGAPTCLMGLSFAALHQAVHDRRSTSGYKVGILQFANIVGCVAGSLLVGLLLFSTLGTPATLSALIGSGSGFAVLGVCYARPRLRFAVAGLTLIVLAAYQPGWERFWQRLHGLDGGPALFDEDETGVVALVPEAGNRWRLSVNGRGQSFLPYGGIHSKLGALAVTLHPAPERVAIIGLGSGDTAWAAACRPETRCMTVFEICSVQSRLLHRLSATNRLPHLGRFLLDRRITIVEADGRKGLATDHQTYDVIEADAIRPNGAYSGNLYSLEFFRLCAGKLKPGGLMCSWSPTPRTRATFRQAFAHVLEVDGGAILIGSDQPIGLDPVAWHGRLCSSAVADYLGEEILAECVSSLSQSKLLPADSGPAVQINTDLSPRDEYHSN